MLDWGHPLALTALCALPLIRWLHRWGPSSREAVVSSLLLWPSDAFREGGVRRLLERPDPAWRLRALVFALLVLAAASPRWNSRARAAVEVWFDDSPSLLAVEGGRLRSAAAAEALVSALKSAAVPRAVVRSLRTPGRSLSLELYPVPTAQDSLSRWIRPGENSAPLPPRATLRAENEHWLVTDGATGDVGGWVSRAPLSRVIRVGAETENVAVTGLSLRRWATGADGLAALVRVANVGRRPAARALEVSAGGQVLFRRELALKPGEVLAIPFDAGPRRNETFQARLLPSDALPSDDELSASPEPVLPTSVALDSSCGPRLRAALETHPGIRIVEASSPAPAMQVGCGPAAPPGDTWLWFRPTAGEPAAEPVAWSPLAGPLADLTLAPSLLRVSSGPPHGPLSLLTAGDRTVISLAGKGRVEARLDPEWPALTARPEYPALVSGLLDLAAGRPLLDPVVSEARNEAAHRIAPLDLPRPPRAKEPASGPQSAQLALVPLLAAFLLLLPELRRARSRALRAGWMLLLAALALGLWNPRLPGFRTPLDLVVLWDDSESSRSPSDAVPWKPIVDAAGGLPGGSRVALVRFAGRPTVQLPLTPTTAKQLPRTLETAWAHDAGPLDPTGTDLEAALDAGLRLVEPGRPASLLVVGDGCETRGEARKALQAASSAGVEVRSWSRFAPAWKSDSWISDVRAPPEAKTGTEFQVTAVLGTGVPRRGQLELSVDGTTVDRMPVELVPGYRKIAALRGRVEKAGPAEVRVDLRTDGDPIPQNNQRRIALSVTGPPRVLFVTSNPAASLAASSLERGGWQVETLTPEALGRAPEDLSRASAVVLDDVGVNDAPARAWEDLERAVRKFGTGLVVLGGPGSFAAGGYRGSRLETLLPVSAEPSRPGEKTAVVFLVDTSGSMGQDLTGHTPLQLAGAAVEATAKALPKGSVVGLTVFDVEPREFLALGAALERGPALSEAARQAPRGGTRAAPALRLAGLRLSGAAVQRRIVVLLTDGHVGDPPESLAASARGLREAGIKLLCLATGEDVRTDTLKTLAEHAGGKLLRVGKDAEIPLLLRRELSGSAAPTSVSGIPVKQTRSVPFLPGVASWPPLNGYCVTRPMPGSSVFLESPDGDPLLAFGRAGAGAVAVLPGGLGAWAPQWAHWPQWGRFVGGLLDWVQKKGEDPLLAVRLLRQPGEMAVEVDSLGADQRWATVPEVAAHLTDPADAHHELRLAAVAPGRYRSSIPLASAGRYWVSVPSAEGSVGRAAWVESVEEYLPPGAGTGFTEWAREGLIRAWNPGSSFYGARDPRPAPAQRPWVVSASACLLLGLLSWERTGAFLAGKLRAYLESRSSREDPISRP